MTRKESWYDPPYNLVDMVENSAKKFPNRNSIGIQKSDGTYHFLTYRQIGERVDNLRGGLAQLGVEKGDAVGVIVKNSIEWAVAAFASYGRGARFVPMYEKEREQVWRYIISDSGLKVLFVVDNSIYEKVKHLVDEIESLEKIIVINGDGPETMESLEKLGQSNPVASIKPHWSDIAAIVYTSGTTGDPKGVLLSHGNFTSNIQAAANAFPTLDENTISLSILPWAHSFGQTGELYLGIYLGGATGLIGSVDTIVEDLQKVKPTILIAVPRIFNRVYDGIHRMMKEKGGISEFLFNLAKSEAKKKRETGNASILYYILDRIVFSKIRAKFGGRLKLAITGSAVMNPEIGTFFSDIGIATYDCYGLTETSPAMTINSPLKHRIGSVGRAIDKVTVVIDKSMTGENSEDGEIVCHGPNVMQGYHNKPEQTAKVLIDDPKLGVGFRTGDRGKLDKDGFLFITGRFKEEYKLENGKYVHPASIEEDIKLNPYIANAMIFGEGKPFNVCLLVPDFDSLKSFIESIGCAGKAPQQLVQETVFVDFVESQVVEQLKPLYGGYEIPRKFLIIDNDFSVDNGLLTQTMKLRRLKVMEKYGEQLVTLFEEGK
ncbi:MAG: long-chain fatty acid--CoA ligase [Candidatus Magnetomorum sp.]|nr:long-chain fatty acid--CoA ligase [Candidatus Magnetomorum sp.]